MRQRMERPFRNKWLTLISMCAICLCLLVGGYMLYQRSIEDAVSGTTISYMDQMANHDIRNVGSQIDSRLDYLHSLGNRLQLVHEDEQVDIPYLLSVDAQATQFYKLYLITTQGTVYDSAYLVTELEELPWADNYQAATGDFVSRFAIDKREAWGSTCFMESSWTGRFPTAASRLRGLWGWFPWRS